MKILWITNMSFPEAFMLLKGDKEIVSGGGWMVGGANALVATMNDGGTRDVVVDGVNGFLVESKDVDGIVRKISVLMSDNGKIAMKMARKNPKIRKKFETKEIALVWREILTKEG